MIPVGAQNPRFPVVGHRYFSCLSFRSGAGLKVDLCEQLRGDTPKPFLPADEI